jgi:hypothetical protein
VFSFQVPTKGSVAASRDRAKVHRRIDLAVFIGFVEFEMQEA